MILFFIGAAIVSTAWTDSESLRQRASRRHPVVPPRYTLDLDAPAETRWAPILTQPRFANLAKDGTAYFEKYLPAWSIPIIEALAADLRPHFVDYGAEMEGIAKALKGPVGLVVAVNLVYQLEGIGANCEARNNTGPCPPPSSPGLCTSVVVENSQGHIIHGRNLDWNLDSSLLKYVINVDYQRNGKTIFTGSQIAGMTGILHGMMPGGFSASMNARNVGGNLVENLWDFVTVKGAMAPTQALRKTFETHGDFDGAVEHLAVQKLINPVYYIIGGLSGQQGAIVSRERKGALNTWYMNHTDDRGGNHQPSWYRLETNYDHWEPVPSYDDRRTPGVAHMGALGQKGTTLDTLKTDIMEKWPTFNHHTDITGMMSASLGHWADLVWLNETNTEL